MIRLNLQFIEIANRYQELASMMETKYMGEVEALLELLADTNIKLTRAQTTLLEKEKVLFISPAKYF